MATVWKIGKTTKGESAGEEHMFQLDAVTIDFRFCRFDTNSIDTSGPLFFHSMRLGSLLFANVQTGENVYFSPWKLGNK